MQTTADFLVAIDARIDRFVADGAYPHKIHPSGNLLRAPLLFNQLLLGILPRRFADPPNVALASFC
jgi:hypothetical protein